MVTVFTSLTFSYLNRARVLLSTIKKYHKDWNFVAIISDVPPKEFEWDPELDYFDEIVFLEDLMGKDNAEWIERHNIVELCTAVKGAALCYVMSKYPNGKYFYIDPDIALFAPLTPLEDLLNENNILLTPHQLEPNIEDYAIMDNEISSLIHGTYNLGFVAVNYSESAHQFANWWNEMLYRFCRDDKENGLFVDQKWCDLVPAFFDGVKVVRDPGYNVASWNLSKRTITIDDSGSIFINGAFLLRFFHFTKLGKVGLIMLERYARENVEVYEVWNWYERVVESMSDNRIPDRYWFYKK